MKFQFIANYRGSLPRSRLRCLMGVTDRGLRAWRQRPPSPRQRCDMVILAHIRDQHRLSPGSYGKQARPKHSAFKAYEPGYIHIDVKYLVSGASDPQPCSCSH